MNAAPTNLLLAGAPQGNRKDSAAQRRVPTKDVGGYTTFAARSLGNLPS
jgi:hypothetical protein